MLLFREVTFVIKRSINSIIHDQLLGYASEEDKKQLQSWLDSSQENR